MTEGAIFSWKYRSRRGRNEPKNDAIQNQEIGRENSVRSKPPEEKTDIHDFPRRDAIGNDEAEGHDPEWGELHGDRTFDKRATRHQDTERRRARDDELEFHFLYPGTLAQVSNVEGDNYQGCANHESGKKCKERPIIRYWNELVTRARRNCRGT